MVKTWMTCRLVTRDVDLGYVHNPTLVLMPADIHHAAATCFGDKGYQVILRRKTWVIGPGVDADGFTLILNVRQQRDHFRVDFSRNGDRVASLAVVGNYICIRHYAADALEAVELSAWVPLKDGQSLSIYDVTADRLHGVLVNQPALPPGW